MEKTSRIRQSGSFSNSIETKGRISEEKGRKEITKTRREVETRTVSKKKT